MPDLIGGSLRWTCRLATAGLMAMPLWVPMVSSRRAGADSAFSGQATAVGLSITGATQEDPTATTLEVAGPVATATVSSLPDSEAFASYPFPGRDVLDLLNLLGPSVPVPLPQYPAAVQSASPGKPHQAVSAPGYVISASSTETTSHGRGESGVDGGSVRFGSVVADSIVETPGDGRVSAIGDTVAEAITIGPLTISSFSSHAEARLDASGHSTVTSSMSIGTVAISGQKIGLTDHGLTLPGTTAPLPDTSPTAAALRQAGIGVTYLAPQRAGDGVIGPGIAMTVRQADPNRKYTTITYTVGQASASAAPGTNVGQSSNTAGATSIDASGSSGSGEAVAPAVTNGQSGGLGTAGAVTAPMIATAGSRAGVSHHTGKGPSSLTHLLAGEHATLAGGPFFYLILVAAAAAALGVGQLMRFLGVR